MNPSPPAPAGVFFLPYPFFFDRRKMEKRMRTRFSSTEQLMSAFAKGAISSMREFLAEYDDFCAVARSTSLAFGPFGRERLHDRRVADERWRVQQLLYKLKSRRFATINTIGKRIEITLTKSGKMRALREQIRLSNGEMPAGSVCMVVFDIPESVSRKRALLRDFLRSAGFECLQRSVWTTKRNVIEPLKQLIDAMHCDKWVRVFSATHC
jgi:hypothetical protein